jgi:hypothetical protein
VLHGVEVQATFADFKVLGERLGGLPPGTYVARLRNSPFVDDLGLSVDWVAATHLVVGTLAAEDVDG